MKALVALAFVAGACGGDKKTPDAGADSPPPIDAPPPTVLTVDCATVTPVGATITATDGMFSYMPATDTINLNDVKKFTMPSTHNVVPNAMMSDSGLHVSFNETKCLKFTKQGTFGFHCGPHGFLGTITVQ